MDEIAAADSKDDEAVASIRSADELATKQASWCADWVEGLGGLPARTPLNAQEGPIVTCDGFTLQNILFESQPGVYVVGHLALPMSSRFTPPYPAVLMANGHSNESILAPRYAAHLAMMARAGFAAFSWDPISQGERRQSKPQYDYTDNCSTEHTRLGFRGWLVGWNFARFLIWDGMRALDYLETRKDVDCTKVGICGTSGGGTQSAYLQALDPRIKVAFPNCFVSSIRAVFAERGCHDAEQFFWRQLTVGVNHAAILAMGCPRVALATGSRWKDYFPQKGAEETFAVYSGLCGRLVDAESSPRQKRIDCPWSDAAGTPRLRWHFHCDGPHGLPMPTRQAQVDWMTYCIKGGPTPKPLADYWALSTGDHSGTNDPCTFAALPFPKDAAFFTATHNVRDIKGFRSVYDILADRARELAQKRAVVRRRTDAQREIVRRRAGIRTLAELLGGPLGDRPLPGTSERGPLSNPTIPQSNNQTISHFDHPNFGWWYLKGVYGCRRENEAAMMATLGRSVVGRDAERIILGAVAAIRKDHPEVTIKELVTSSVQPSTSNLQPSVPLKAARWDCIAAAHAYAAEPQLFSRVEFTDPPPSWTEMVTNPDPKNDSFAIAVWGALEEYDWTDLVDKRQDKELMTMSDGMCGRISVKCAETKGCPFPLVHFAEMHPQGASVHLQLCNKKGSTPCK